MSAKHLIANRSSGERDVSSTSRSPAPVSREPRLYKRDTGNPDEWWVVGDDARNRMRYPMNKTWEPIWRIMETDEGKLAPKPCQQCKDRKQDHRCRVYTEDAMRRYNLRTVACARCRATRQPDFKNHIGLRDSRHHHNRHASDEALRGRFHHESRRDSPAALPQRDHSRRRSASPPGETGDRERQRPRRNDLQYPHPQSSGSPQQRDAQRLPTIRLNDASAAPSSAHSLESLAKRIGILGGMMEDHIKDNKVLQDDIDSNYESIGKLENVYMVTLSRHAANAAAKLGRSHMDEEPSLQQGGVDRMDTEPSFTQSSVGPSDVDALVMEASDEAYMRELKQLEQLEQKQRMLEQEHAAETARKIADEEIAALRGGIEDLKSKVEVLENGLRVERQVFQSMYNALA